MADQGLSGGGAKGEAARIAGGARPGVGAANSAAALNMGPALSPLTSSFLEGPVIFTGCTCEGTRKCYVGTPLFVARALGLGSYFTGYRCNQGHVDFRKTEDKTCIECQRVDKRSYRRRHASRIRRRQHQRIKVRYHSDSKFRQKVLAKQAARWRALSLEEKRQHRDERERRWKERSPDAHRLYKKAKRARGKARRRGAAGSHTAADIKLIYKAQKGRCAYFAVCRTGLGHDYHEDHIIPIALGGTNDASNIQLTCPACNWSKHASHPVDFAQRIGLLV